MVKAVSYWRRWAEVERAVLHSGWTCPSRAGGWCTDTDAAGSSLCAPPPTAPAPAQAMGRETKDLCYSWTLCVSHGHHCFEELGVMFSIKMCFIWWEVERYWVTLEMGNSLTYQQTLKHLGKCQAAMSNLWPSQFFFLLLSKVCFERGSWFSCRSLHSNGQSETRFVRTMLLNQNTFLRKTIKWGGQKTAACIFNPFKTNSPPQSTTSALPD